MSYGVETSVELDRVFAATLARDVRSLAVCGPNPGEGVTTLVEALAKRNLLAGRSTLVVDLNLNQPRLDQAFSLPRGAAGEALLPGPQAVDLPEEYRGARLSVVSAPIERAGIVSLRAPGTLEEQVSSLLEDYDSVIVDTAPVNVPGSIMPAERVAAACDGTIISVLSGNTTGSCLERAVEALNDAGAHLLGVVMNDRDNPPLKEEMLREVRRISRLLPGTSHWLSERIRKSRILALDT